MVYNNRGTTMIEYYIYMYMNHYGRVLYETASYFGPTK